MEFALVFPVCVLLVFGALELSWVLMQCNVLASAARQGVRRGTFNGATNSAVVTTVNQSLQAGGITGASTTIRVNGGQGDLINAPSGSQISVTVSVPYSAISINALSGLIPEDAIVSRTVVMRRE